jgi:hypothetical protein
MGDDEREDRRLRIEAGIILALMVLAIGANIIRSLQ